MPRRRAIIFVHEPTGLAFGFWPDNDDPSTLHITARHGTTPDDAHKRFETLTATHGLYWYWWRQDQIVGVISCFQRKEA